MSSVRRPAALTSSAPRDELLRDDLPVETPLDMAAARRSVAQVLNGRERHLVVTDRRLFLSLPVRYRRLTDPYS